MCAHRQTHTYTHTHTHAHTHTHSHTHTHARAHALSISLSISLGLFFIENSFSPGMKEGNKGRLPKLTLRRTGRLVQLRSGPPSLMKKKKSLLILYPPPLCIYITLLHSCAQSVVKCVISLLPASPPTCLNQFYRSWQFNNSFQECLWTVSNSRYVCLRLAGLYRTRRCVARNLHDAHASTEQRQIYSSMDWQEEKFRGRYSRL